VSVKAERLEGEFAPRGVSHDGGDLLLHPPDALALVDRAAEEGVPIVVVDGLGAGASRRAHPLERVADFSAAVAEGHGCWEVADAVIRDRSEPGMVFRITLGGDPIEAV
jgi:hypothetical protein